MPRSARQVQHLYVSTACQHGFCGDCQRPEGIYGNQKIPAVCKYCETSCLCPCHRFPPVQELLAGEPPNG